MFIGWARTKCYLWSCQIHILPGESDNHLHTKCNVVNEMKKPFSPEQLYGCHPKSCPSDNLLAQTFLSGLLKKALSLWQPWQPKSGQCWPTFWQLVDNLAFCVYSSCITPGFNTGKQGGKVLGSASPSVHLCTRHFTQGWNIRPLTLIFWIGVVFESWRWRSWHCRSMS